MKRLVLFFALLIVAAALFGGVGIGYSIAPFGEVAADNSEFYALSSSFIFSPSLKNHIGEIEADVALSYTAPFFNGLKLKLSSPLFILKNHPFDFLFPNDVLWAPKLSLGAEYRMKRDIALFAALSPFAFFDTDFAYEFFSPFVLYDFNQKNLGLGMYIMKFSVYFGG